MNRAELMKKARTVAHQLLEEKGYISAVDVLMAMGRLSKHYYERWRFRQVPHLQKVLPGSLNEHAFFCRELQAYATDELQLKPSHTAYVSWGKGRRQPLRFSKYGRLHLEQLFSTHYVRPAQPANLKASRPPLVTRVPADRNELPSPDWKG